MPYVAAFWGLLLWILTGGRMFLPPSNIPGTPAAVRPPGIAARQESSAASPKKFSDAIEDNSFFIEEAYNQDPHVVQNIFQGYRFGGSHAPASLSFTQEWPAFGLRHQLSYTIPYTSFFGTSASGLNDILINYRYQLFEEGKWAAVAPRLSLILPTGRVAAGLGNGVVGIQVALPASKRLSDEWAVHANLGWTMLPRAKGSTSDGRPVRADLSSYYGGASLIYLAGPWANIFLEVLVSDNAEFDGAGSVVRRVETLLNPALRFAVNFGHLQIVPGAAVPFSFSRGEAKVGILIYLSFEFPYAPLI
jgi:hypothetical protein